MLVFFANLVRAGCASIVTLLAARWLGPAEFGHFSTFLALTIFAYALVGEGFDPSVVRLYAKLPGTDVEGKRRVLGSALALRGLLALPMLLLFWGAAAWWLAPVMADISRLASLAALGASVAMLGLAVLQAGERFYAYAALAPVANLLRLLAMPVLWVFGALTLSTLMWSYVLAFAVAVGLAFWLLREEWRQVRFDAAMLWELLRFGAWSSLANACFMLMAYVPVPVLTQVRGAAEGGLYSAAVTLLLLIDQYTASLLTAKLVRTSRIDTLAGLKQFMRHLGLRLSAMGALLCLLFPLSSGIVNGIFGEAYAGASPVMQALLPGFIATLVSHPLYLVLYAMNKPQSYAISGVVALATFAVFAVWLLPGHGMLGMAWATSVARAFQAIMIVGMVVFALRRGARGGQDVLQETKAAAS
jgi:O-antigen/teichoic acid export membrane protein